MARGLGSEGSKGSKVLVTHAKRFIKAKEELDGCKKKKSAAEEKLKRVQKDFAEAMKSEQVRSFKNDKLGGFRTQIELYPNNKKDGVFEKWVKRRKSLKFLWTTNVNGSKLKAWVKELKEQGKPLPPGLDPYEETQIRRY